MLKLEIIFVKCVKKLCKVENKMKAKINKTLKNNNEVAVGLIHFHILSLCTLKIFYFIFLCLDELKKENALLFRIQCSCRIFASVQGVREISVIIVADNYLWYNETRIPYNFFFLILIFKELFTFKTRMNNNIERRGALLCTGRKSNCYLRSHTDPFAVSTGVASTFRPEH